MVGREDDLAYPPRYMEEIGWKPCPPRSVTRVNPGSPPQATPLKRVPREPPTAGVGDVGTRDPPGELNALERQLAKVTS